MKLNSIISSIIYLSVVIIVVISGAYTTEIIKSFFAYLVDFNSFYDSRIWVQTFSPIQAMNEGEFLLKYSVIDLSGKLFTWIISIFGFRILIKSKSELAILIGFSFNLFFMRGVCISIIETISGTAFCTNNSIWKLLEINHQMASIVYSTIGLTVFVFLFYKLNKKQRLPFFIYGFLGSSIGLFLWVKYLGKMIL